MADWYYARNNQQQGPVSEEEFRQLATSGGLKPTDLVWREGMAGWADAATVPGLLPDVKPASTATAPQPELPPRPEERRARQRDDDWDDRPRRPRSKPMSTRAVLAIVGVSVAAVILVVGLLLYFLLRPAPTTELALGPNGANVQEVLSPRDAPDRVRRTPCRIYQVKLEAGKTYTIDMMSNQFDAFLRLEDDNSMQLMIDDDGGEGLNARIVFQPPRTATFQIVATTFGGGTGSYTLSVREGLPIGGRGPFKFKK